MRFLLLNQCFYPDVVSTAQHLTDLARELSDRGHEVTVLTSDRGYDDPAKRFPRRELWKGITILRIPSLSLGKRSKLKRVLNFGSFLVICAFRLLALRRFDVVIALTSPPLISFLGALFVALKGGRFCFWVMDLNPDEAIAAGWLNENSLTAGLLKRMLNFSLRRADRTIVLDRFMRERILEKGVDNDRVSVLPPWSHDDSVKYSAVGRENFRTAQNLTDKFVVMYSGNHSPCHPLDTLLEAALDLKEQSRIAFCFVGGGSEQLKVQEFARRHDLGNVHCLPYQTLEKLSASLSAADLHVVVLGEKFTGIVHPCKIYNVMSIGIPMLYIGPEKSHIADIGSDLEADQVFSARHGDHVMVRKQIEAAVLNQNGAGKTPAHAQRFSKHALLPQMLNLIEFNSAEAEPIQETVQSSAKAQ